MIEKNITKKKKTIGSLNLLTIPIINCYVLGILDPSLHGDKSIYKIDNIWSIVVWIKGVKNCFSQRFLECGFLKRLRNLLFVVVSKKKKICKTLEWDHKREVLKSETSNGRKVMILIDWW